MTNNWPFPSDETYPSDTNYPADGFVAVEGVLSASVCEISPALPGQLGCGGAAIAALGSLAFVNTGLVGLQGSVQAIVADLAALLSGKLGNCADATLAAAVFSELLGRIGAQGTIQITPNFVTLDLLGRNGTERICTLRLGVKTRTLAVGIKTGTLTVGVSP